MRFPALALLVVGCAPPAQPPVAHAEPAEPVAVGRPLAAADAVGAAASAEPGCLPFVWNELYAGVTRLDGGSVAQAFDRADAAARGDHEEATGAAADGDMRSASRSFLSCAARYRKIGAEVALRRTATRNAEVCYRNAIYAFAMAGQLATEGRPLLEEAAAEDPLLADFLRARLADAPRDCPVRRVAAPTPPGR